MDRSVKTKLVLAALLVVLSIVTLVETRVVYAYDPDTIVFTCSAECSFYGGGGFKDATPKGVTPTLAPLLASSFLIGIIV